MIPCAMVSLISVSGAQYGAGESTNVRLEEIKFAVDAIKHIYTGKSHEHITATSIVIMNDILLVE